MRYILTERKEKENRTYTVSIYCHVANQVPEKFTKFSLVKERVARARVVVRPHNCQPQLNLLRNANAGVT